MTDYYKPGYTRVGSIVSMRHRFQQFLNEPYDIVHPDQTFGYVNAKYRPCLIVGADSLNVYVVPIKRLEHKPRWLEVENGGFILNSDTIARVGLNRQCEGMAIGCGELHCIPKQDFTYQRIIGILPKSVFKSYITTLKAYEASRATSTHPLQGQFDLGRPDNLDFLNSSETWVKYIEPRFVRRIHKRDVINKLGSAKYELSKYLSKHKVTEMTPSQEKKHLRLRKDVARLEAMQDQTVVNLKYELREHYLAIDHGYGTKRSQVRHHPYNVRK